MIKIQHPYQDQVVIDSILQTHQSRKFKHEQAKRLWKKYQSLILGHIQKSILLVNKDQIEQGYLFINLKSLTHNLGRYEGKYYWSHWFQNHFPLVEIIKKGNNFSGELTMVELKYDLEYDLDFETAAEKPDQSHCVYYVYQDYLNDLYKWDEGQSDLFDFVRLDRRSLESYILATDHLINNSTETYKLKTYRYNLQVAITLYQCACFFEKANYEFGIPQRISESEYGRRYYRSLNLQNIPKIVRHAALGTCWQYDIESSVFAWQYHVVKQIDPTLNWPATLEYIDLKTAIRRRLTEHLKFNVSNEYKIDLVKQVITAIGFGSQANANESRWQKGSTWEKPAIDKIIHDPKSRYHLLQDKWLREFITEQRKMKSKIISHYYNDLIQIPFLLDKMKLRKNKAISYLYQQAERQLINVLVDSSKNRNEFLLLVHDGFYTSRPQKLLDLREKLMEVNPWAKISMEHHRGYIFHNDKDHRTFIQEQEQLANQGHIPQEVAKNYKRIQNKLYLHTEYRAQDEYDNGYRSESHYDYELDPFYDDDNEEETTTTI